MNIHLDKFLSIVGFDPTNVPGKNDTTSFRKTGDKQWTFTQQWGKNVDTLTLTTYHQKYTRIQLTVFGRNPDDWVRLAECAKTLRRMTKTCLKQWPYCVDITYGKGERLQLYCEMIVEGVYNDKRQQPVKRRKPKVIRLVV